MCHNKNFTVLTKHFTKKLNQTPCKIFYTANIKTLPKGTIFDTNNLQQGELINMDFELYYMNSIPGFTSMITVLCLNNIIIWVLSTAPKQPPF